MPARCTRAPSSWSAVLVALVLAATRATASEPFAVIEGRVEVLRKGLLGAAAPGDPSGVIVYVTGFTRPALARSEQLDQRDEQFHPRILPIVAGQTVTFPNRDRIYHNVFSVSPVHSFDLGQYRSSDPPKSEPFPTPGLVPVYCNIHPSMIAYVAVLENDAFAKSGPDGRFRIERVPPGERVVQAFLPGAERVSQTLAVEAGRVHELAFTLVAGRIPPHKRKDGSDYPRPGSDLERP